MQRATLLPGNILPGQARPLNFHPVARSLKGKVSLGSKKAAAFGQSVLLRKPSTCVCAATSAPNQQVAVNSNNTSDEGASTDLSIISKRLAKVRWLFQLGKRRKWVCTQCVHSLLL